MKAKDMRELTVDQLSEKLNELDTELFNSRFNAKMGALENPGVLRKVRKDIARVKTILTEKQRKG